MIKGIYMKKGDLAQARRYDILECDEPYFNEVCLSRPARQPTHDDTRSSHNGAAVLGFAAIIRRFAFCANPKFRPQQALAAPVIPCHPRVIAGAVDGDLGGRIRAGAQPILVQDKRGRPPSRKARRLRIGLLVAGTVLPAIANAPRAAAFQFRVDDWVTECRTPVDCSVTGLFQQTNLDGRRGSFALVIMLRSRQLAVVGQPFPLRARLQIDGNNPVECAGTRYCIFPSRASRRAIGELSTGSLVLVDVYTVKDVFRSSLSTIGYQDSLAKLRAEGYAVPAS
jgi:hypothetical protein